MDEKTAKQLAGQLRQPHGTEGLEVALQMNQANARMNNAAIEVLKPQAGETIMELGMGNGRFVRDLLEIDPSIRYIGCDYSDLMVRESSTTNSDLIVAGRAQFYLATADDLPLEDDTVNGIFTVNTLYFWEDPAAILTEMRRVLKPGGRLVISIRPERTMRQLPFVEYGFKTYSTNSLTELLTNNHFDIIETLEEKEPEQIIEDQAFSLELTVVAARVK